MTRKKAYTYFIGSHDLPLSSINIIGPICMLTAFQNAHSLFVWCYLWPTNWMSQVIFFMFEVTSKHSSVRPSVRLCLIKHLFTLSNPVFQSLALQLDSIQDSYLACQSVLLFILTIHPSAVFRSMHVITHNT